MPFDGPRRACAGASSATSTSSSSATFTSDHGEYAGSHGLRDKGGGVYDEGIQVPLYVKDPRGQLTQAPEVPRRQLSSSVDVAPLLLTIATGSNGWRGDPRYSHLSRRADLAAICADPGAPGRPWIVHATDEVATEFCPQPYAASAPRHVVAVRTNRAKYALYSNWRPGTLEIEGGDDDRRALRLLDARRPPRARKPPRPQPQRGDAAPAAHRRGWHGRRALRRTQHVALRDSLSAP